jgi:flagellar basal body-associated protein FliL
MADKAEKKAETPAAAPAEKPADKAAAKGGGGLLSKTPVLLGGAMLAEAVVLIFGFWLLRGGTPRAANGANLVDTPTTMPSADDTQDKNSTVEIDLVDFKALNRLSGHSLIYDVSIWITTKPQYQKRVEELIKDRDALIKDRIRTIIAELDPDKLGGGSEPGLETLRRQVKYQLDEILGEGLVDEVLVPRCIPYRADF